MDLPTITVNANAFVFKHFWKEVYGCFWQPLLHIRDYNFEIAKIRIMSSRPMFNDMVYTDPDNDIMTVIFNTEEDKIAFLLTH